MSMGVLINSITTSLFHQATGTDGDGLTSNLMIVTLSYLNSRTVRSNTWLPVSYRWQMTGMASALSLSMEENPSVAPSTDPIFQIQALLPDYPLSAEAFTTLYYLPCTSLTRSAAGSSPENILEVRLINRNDVSDRIRLVGI